MNIVMNFLDMGGYAFYVWASYGSVIALLFLMWLMPWRRWQKYIRICERTTSSFNRAYYE